MTAVPRNFPFRQVLAGAFVLPWRHRVDVTHAAGLPLLAIVVAMSCADAFESSFVGFSGQVALLLAMLWLALAMHRLVLVLDWQPQRLFGELKLGRLLRFFGAGIWLAIVYTAVYLLVMATLAFAGEAAGSIPQEESVWDRMFSFDGWANEVGSALAYLVIGRLSLVFPAIALDRDANYGAFWRMSRGNGWRVAITVGALPWFLDSIISAMWREETSLFEIAGLGVLTGVVTIVEVIALSLTYRELTHAFAPPPTHPPG